MLILVSMTLMMTRKLVRQTLLMILGSVLGQMKKDYDDSIRDLSVAEALMNTHFNNAKGDAHYNKQTYYDEHLF